MRLYVTSSLFWLLIGQLGLASADGTSVCQLSPGQLSEAIRPDSVLVAYFHKKGSDESKAGISLIAKLHLYLKRRPFINARVCKVTCEDMSSPYCRPGLVNVALHAFRRGHPRVTLTLDTASPLDAAIASSLHLWLANNITVLHNERELEEMQQKCIGYCDVLVAHFPSLGAREHRILLEALVGHLTAAEGNSGGLPRNLLKSSDTAKPLEDLQTGNSNALQLRVAMSSSAEAVSSLAAPLYQSAEDQPEESMVWMLLCREAPMTSEKEPMTSAVRCPQSALHDRLELETLTPFISAHMKPGWVLATDTGGALQHPFDTQRQHLVLMVADTATLSLVTSLAPALGNIFRGTVGFVAVNLDKVPVGALSQYHIHPDQLEPPSLVFIDKGTNSASAISNKFDDVIGFIHDQLVKRLKADEKERQLEELEREDMDKAYGTVPADKVLKQDDELELTMQGSRMHDLGDIRTITEEQFRQLQRNMSFRLVVGYLPWDPLSRWLLRGLATVPVSLRQHCVALSCLDWSELCDSLEIRSFPSVVIVSENSTHLFNGTLTISAIREQLVLGSTPSPVPVTTHQLDAWKAGKLSKTPIDVTDRMLILSDNMPLTVDAVRRLRWHIVIGKMDTATFFTRFGVKNPVCVKRADPFEQRVDLEIRDLMEMLARCELVLPELTEENYAVLWRHPWKFIVFCAPPTCPQTKPGADSDNVNPLVRAAAQAALNYRHFLWMNSSAPVAQHVRQQYRVRSLSALVAVSVTSGQVIHYTGRPSATEMLAWAQNIMANNVKGEILLKSEPWLPVLPPIQFGESPEPSGSAEVFADGFSDREELRVINEPRTRREEL